MLLPRQAYARELDANFGIVFNELFTITNMPIKRYADHLYKGAPTQTPPLPRDFPAHGSAAPCCGPCCAAPASRPASDASFAAAAGELQAYMQLLVDSFNVSTVDHLMCRTLVSVHFLDTS